MRNTVVYASLITWTLVACGGGGETTSPTHAPSLKVVSPIATDTVVVVASDRLRVEVRDSSGQLAPGVHVQFRIPLPAGETNLAMNGAYVCDASRSACATFTPTSSSVTNAADAVSDASGIASALLQHGLRAMTGSVEVSAPSLNVSVAAPYTTLPGNLASFVMSEADTSVYVGKSYPLVAHAADRLGNVRTEAVTIAAQTPNVATFANGQVTAVAIGRGSFSVSAAGFVQTAHVSVPPPGRLVASDRAQGSGLGLVLLDTDGGSRRSFATTKGHVGFAFPGWSADDRRVTVLESGADGRARIIAYDTATSARTAPVDTVAFPETLEPSYPKTGTSMYFYGTRNGTQGVYRSNVDGSGAQFIVGGAFGIVSPDELALIIGRAAGLMKYDLGTAQETLVAVSNYTPFWAPAGD